MAFLLFWPFFAIFPGLRWTFLQSVLIHSFLQIHLELLRRYCFLSIFPFFCLCPRILSLILPLISSFPILGHPLLSFFVLLFLSLSLGSIKGTVSRDFLTLVFFIKQLLLVTSKTARQDFKFFQIFEELFEFVIDSSVYSLPGSRDSPVFSSPGSRDSPVYSSPGTWDSSVYSQPGSHFTDFKEQITFFKGSVILKIDCRLLYHLGDMRFMFAKIA